MTEADAEVDDDAETQSAAASQTATGSDAAGHARSGANLSKEDVVLEAHDLVKAFGALVATDHASFQVERGSITGLIGPNGAGKSTLFNLVSGFYEPDSGHVEVNGTDVTDLEPYEIADYGLIRTFQTPRKLEGMTVREAMMVGPQHQPGESFVKLFTSPDEVREHEEQNLSDVERILGEFEIDHLATQPATKISGGQMKLVELARAMLAEPDILLLDEPAAGVNPTLRNKLAEQIRRLHDQGTTFLLIEHDMEFVMSLADPVIVLDRGSVLMEGTPEEVQTDERVIDAYLGG
ncbi:ABC transporter ATP-binding protein [Haloglomus litoreum]|uniref:ABC transporter ATP-binding protein n=1 Tax=Haloglomus litoreum TaxID=3034026 RepID=UPI0023E8A263|nr:ABC transporter ATP-binding protein [Haloglomus sp. DT116]